MTETSGDFPTINPRFVGRKQRYAYVATMVTGFGAAVKWDGVAKMDLWAPEGSDAMVAKIQLPPGCYNGETVFIPRHEDPSKCTSEDDGYLVTYVHDETASSSSSSSSGGGGSSSGGSSLVVWDAATMQQQPLAVVALPQRVPYGFHGLWVPERQFQQQLTSQPLQPTSLMQ
ncbi:hypothetical protein OEZ86_008657 [Tetradesmus obliquus]|nr:hypothetical protein OEZ86_008657 [Tetradesmus obliquus]